MSTKKNENTVVDIPTDLHDRLKEYDAQIFNLQRQAENLLQGYIYSLTVDYKNVNFDIQTGKLTFEK